MKWKDYDKCPECDVGRFEWTRDGDCACYIAFPCSACVPGKLECNNCGTDSRDCEPKTDLVSDAEVMP